MSTSLPEAKSFEISKREVWQAYERVKANKGAPGVDRVNLEDVRDRSAGQPVQDLESDVVGVLLPAAGACGADPEA